MRLRSPEYCGCKDQPVLAGAMVRAAVVVVIVGLGGGTSVSRSVAQEAASAVAYVEAVNGRVVAFARGAPQLLDALDAIGDRTRLDLMANSEVRICHYSTGRLHTLRGPLRAAISADGITAENGKTLDRPDGSCTPPVISKFQGGLVSRGLESDTPAAPPPRRRGRGAAP